MPKISERNPVECAEKALNAVNTAAGVVQNLYITFLLLGTYIGLIVASTTDEQLLRGSPVTLPLLNMELPIVGFYAVIPWLLLLFHFNFLLQLHLLGRKLDKFDEFTKKLSNDEGEALWERLANFPIVQLQHDSSIRQHDFFIKMVLILMVGVTVIALPLGLLLWAQIRFLPYHDSDITWGQRAAVCMDVLILWGFSGAGSGGGEFCASSRLYLNSSGTGYAAGYLPGCT
jgi:hypothetical protein